MLLLSYTGIVGAGEPVRKASPVRKRQKHASSVWCEDDPAIAGQIGRRSAVSMAWFVGKQLLWCRREADLVSPTLLSPCLGGNGAENVNKNPFSSPWVDRITATTTLLNLFSPSWSAVEQHAGTGGRQSTPAVVVHFCILYACDGRKSTDGQLRLRREEKKAYESRVALTHGFYSSEMYCGGRASGSKKLDEDVSSPPLKILFSVADVAVHSFMHHRSAFSPYAKLSSPRPGTLNTIR